MPKQFFNSLDEVKKYYPNIDIENKNKENYNYYGKVVVRHGYSWKIKKIFQFFGLLFIAPLIILRTNRQDLYKRLSRTIKKIQNSNETIKIYVQQQLKQNNIDNNNPPLPLKPVAIKELIKDPEPVQQEHPQNEDSVEDRFQPIQRYLNSVLPANEERCHPKMPEKITEFFNSLSDEELQKIVPNLLKARNEELIRLDSKRFEYSANQKKIRKDIVQLLITRVENNPKCMDITSICHLLYLSQYFNLNSIILEKIPMEMVSELAKNFMQSFPEDFPYFRPTLANLFIHSERINDQQKRESLLTKIVESLKVEDIDNCVNSKALLQKGFEEICLSIILGSIPIQEPSVQKKVDIILQSIIVKYNSKIYWNYEEFENFFNRIYSQCKNVEQLIYILNTIPNTINLKEDILKILNQQGLINEFVKQADIALLKRCLCGRNPKIYFAVKTALVDCNKYDEFYALIDEKRKELMRIVTDKGFINPGPTPLNIPFHTKVTDRDGKTVNVIFYDMHKKVLDYSIYELQTDNHVVLGHISLDPGIGKEYLFINSIEIFAEKGAKIAYFNIEKILHEFAVRESFRQNLNGHVHLNTDGIDEFFHFLCGYRYKNPEKEVFSLGIIRNMYKEFSVLLDAYFLRNADQDPEEIVAKIEKFLNDKGNKLSKVFDAFENQAEKTLGRAPKDMKEILDYGTKYDLNKYWERSLEHLSHDKLGPLLIKYEIGEKARDEDLCKDVIHEVENLQKNADEQLQKIFMKMKKDAIAFLQQEVNNINEILMCRKIYKNNGGEMYLSDDAINQWKQILKLQDN